MMQQIRSLQLQGGLTAKWCTCATAIGALMLCIVIGNGAVLLALRRMRRAPAHYPLASLATADLLLGLFVLPVAGMRELFVLHLNWLICASWETLDVFCCTASILSLCVLGWERWCGITAPLARARRAKRSKLLAVLVWPVSLAVALPTIFTYAPIDSHEDIIVCPFSMDVTYVFLSSTLSFYLPAVMMLTLYSRILSALSATPNLRVHRGRSPCFQMSPIGKPAINSTRCSTPLPKNNTQNLQPSPRITSKCCIHIPESSGYLKSAGSSVATKGEHLTTGDVKNSYGLITRQRQATRTIVRLMGLFLACWTPFFVMSPLDSICDCVWDPIWKWCTWLGYTNSALNPIVYAAASPSVRAALHASMPSSVRTTEVPSTPRRRNRAERRPLLDKGLPQRSSHFPIPGRSHPSIAD